MCRKYNVYSVNYDIAHKRPLIRLSALVIMIIFFISYCDRYGGFRKKIIAVSENEDKESQCPFTVVASGSEVLSRDDQYVLNRVYHTKTFKDGNHFHRQIMYVCDKRGDIVNNVAFVQYCFEKEERDFDLKPHGNSCKDGAQGFNRTQSSTLATLKEKCATLSPRKAVRQTKGK